MSRDDEVQHYKLLQLIYNKVKCPTILWLTRKWLRAPIQINGKLHKRRKGLPQGSPLSPLLSNILLDKLDKYLKSKGLKFVRYADDFSIYTKSKAEARNVGNEVYLFLKNKLNLPINREKSGIRRPTKSVLLGRTEHKEMTSLGHFSEGPGCGWVEKGAGPPRRIKAQFWEPRLLFQDSEEKVIKVCRIIT